MYVNKNKTKYKISVNNYCYFLGKRLQNYFRLATRSKAGLPPAPPGFIDFKEELENYTTALKRVIAYNHSVFGDYFLSILTQRQIAPSCSKQIDPACDPKSDPKSKQH